MKKDFVTTDLLRNNALILAKQIYDDEFIPDIIYVSLRGGAFLGNILSEFFKIINNRGKPVFYAAVVARSYADFNQISRVRIDGWTYHPKYLRSGDKVLFVDDIFDTGRTMNSLVKYVMKRGISREFIKVAVHDYKQGSKGRELPVQPDYWCRKLREDNAWVHYMSHELEGLTSKEIARYYLEEHPALAEVFDLIKDHQSTL